MGRSCWKTHPTMTRQFKIFRRGRELEREDRRVYDVRINVRLVFGREKEACRSCCRRREGEGKWCVFLMGCHYMSICTVENMPLYYYYLIRSTLLIDCIRLAVAKFQFKTTK